MIPFLKLAEFTAQKGHKISFISTPRNIQRLPKIPSNLSHLINLISLPLPLDQDDDDEHSLPPNAEATMDVPYHIIPYLKKSYDGLQQPLSQFLETSNLDWIIYDFTPHWLPPIASRLGISQAYFCIFNACTICFMGVRDDDTRTKPDDFTVPPKWVPFPSSVAFRPHEAKQMFDHNGLNVSGVSDKSRFLSTVLGSDLLVIRSCVEIEDEWINLVEELHQKPVVPVGMLPPSSEHPVIHDDEDGRKISEWLDKQEKGSVVYIAFGSEITPSQNDFTEIALGLELSGLPFFWALRVRHDSAQLPDGFVERTTGRGVVWTGWAPQCMILGHDSVGGFLTHCGWSSIIEGLHYGRALIMLPFLGDQGLNAREFTEKNVGLEIPRDEGEGSFTRDLVAKTVKRVVADEEGRIYREKAKEMSLLISDEKRQYRYAEKFVEYLENNRKISN